MLLLDSYQNILEMAYLDVFTLRHCNVYRLPYPGPRSWDLRHHVAANQRQLWLNQKPGQCLGAALVCKDNLIRSGVKLIFSWQFTWGFARPLPRCLEQQPLAGRQHIFVDGFAPIKRFVRRCCFCCLQSSTKFYKGLQRCAATPGRAATHLCRRACSCK